MGAQHDGRGFFHARIAFNCVPSKVSTQAAVLAEFDTQIHAKGFCSNLGLFERETRLPEQD